MRPFFLVVFSALPGCAVENPLDGVGVVSTLRTLDPVVLDAAHPLYPHSFRIHESVV